MRWVSCSSCGRYLQFKIQNVVRVCQSLETGCRLVPTSVVFTPGLRLTSGEQPCVRVGPPVLRGHCGTGTYDDVELVASVKKKTWRMGTGRAQATSALRLRPGCPGPFVRTPVVDASLYSSTTLPCPPCMHDLARRSCAEWRQGVLNISLLVTPTLTIVRTNGMILSQALAA